MDASIPFPSGYAVFPTQYKGISDELLNSLQMTNPQKHGFIIPDYMLDDLNHFMVQLPLIFNPKKGFPSRLQPIRARAFICCCLLKLPVYVCKSNYTDVAIHLSLARPSQNFIIIPPVAREGYRELLTFHSTLNLRSMFQRDVTAALVSPPPLPQLASDFGLGDHEHSDEDNDDIGDPYIFDLPTDTAVDTAESSSQALKRLRRSYRIQNKLPDSDALALTLTRRAPLIPVPHSTAWCYDDTTFRLPFVHHVHEVRAPPRPSNYFPQNLLPFPTAAATVIVNARQYTDDNAQDLFDHTELGSKVKVKKLLAFVPPATEVRAIFIPREILSLYLPTALVCEFLQATPNLFRVVHGCRNKEGEFEVLLGWRWPRNTEYHSREYVGCSVLRQSFIDHPNLPYLRNVHSSYFSAISAFTATCYPLWGNYFTNRY